MYTCKLCCLEPVFDLDSIVDHFSYVHDVQKDSVLLVEKSLVNQVRVGPAFNDRPQLGRSCSLHPCLQL